MTISLAGAGLVVPQMLQVNATIPDFGAFSRTPLTTIREMSQMQACIVRDLDRRAYVPVWRAMQAFTDARGEHTPDELWMVEHDPVFTLGQAGKREHVLMPGDIPVVHVDRGGQVTYHGPEQLVAYPLLDLKRLKVGVREYVHRIEQAVIDTLGHWNIDAARRDGAPGVYVNGAKIAALGIRVRRGCTFHGLAFNIGGASVAPFARINPCGYEGLQVVALSDLGGPSGLEAVKPVLLQALAVQFGLGLQRNAALPAHLEPGGRS